MAKAYHEALHPLGNLGIQVSMAALENTHIPAHWHEAMEIILSEWFCPYSYRARTSYPSAQSTDCF